MQKLYSILGCCFAVVAAVRRFLLFPANLFRHSADMYKQAGMENRKKKPAADIVVPVSYKWGSGTSRRNQPIYFVDSAAVKNCPFRLDKNDWFVSVKGAANRVRDGTETAVAA